jgi:dTDP-4-dehydrorhamnose reductase
MLTILLFGADGQVGWELRRSLSPLGRLIALSRNHVDFEDVSALRNIVYHHRPQIIVNAAAYTAVDKAESDVKTARRINAEAVGLLAFMAKEINAWFVHYSTDYVFDGKHEVAYREDHQPSPLNVYGQTKWEGEQLVQASECNHLLIRTSWVYSSRGNNFVHTMLRLAQERDSIKVVVDQIGAPTSAKLIADITALALQVIIKSSPDTAFQYTGIYHLSARGQTSWHGFATYIIEQAIVLGLPIKAHLNSIVPIATADYPMSAKRPANSLLNTSKLCDTFNVFLPAWEIQVNQAIVKILKKVSYES